MILKYICLILKIESLIVQYSNIQFTETIKNAVDLGDRETCILHR